MRIEPGTENPDGYDPMSDWWENPYRVALGDALTLQVGELDLVAERLSSEWNFFWNYRMGGEIQPRIDRKTAGSAEWAHWSSCRYPFRDPPGSLVFVPQLADRPLVTRPVMPLLVPPAESLTLWISSPLWCRLEVRAEDRTVPLDLDLPVLRFSETWFGPDTLNGDLAYASTTRARMNPYLTRDEWVDFRIQTPVIIHNEEAQVLRVERLNLPLPACGLYLAEEGLISDTLVWNRAGHGQNASLERIPPVHGRLVAAPRQTDTASLLTRAFTRLFD